MNGTTTLGLPMASSNGPNLSFIPIAKVRSSMTRYSLRESASFWPMESRTCQRISEATQLCRHGGAIVPKEAWPTLIDPCTGC